MQLDPSTSSSIPSEITLQAEVITYMDSDLFKAAENGDMELFNKYQGGLHCLVDGRQNTALHIYCRTGGRLVVKIDKRFLFFRKRRFEREFSINFVKQLIDECPSLLLQPNAKGEIPLHVAVRHGHSDIIKFLIERAKDLEATRMKQMLEMADKEGNTALHKAAESADHVVVRLLVKELDPDFSSSANKSGETPIYIATVRRSNLLVAGILDNCKSMDCGGPDGRTALHAATMAINKESARIIIEAQKHLTKETDDKGRTPLHYAAHLGLRSIVQLLLKADPSTAYITDKERGTTALHMAAWSGRTGIMEDIISYCPGCCEIVDKRGWNFLHFAVVSLRPGKLKRFLFDDNNKIKDLPVRNLIDERDINGNTPYHVPRLRKSYSARYFGKVIRIFKHHGSEGSFYLYSSTESKIMEFMKDIANNAEVAGKPVHRNFREIVKEVEKEDIPEHEIEQKARENHLLVATLVATVTFAAAFTVPGGNKSEQGTATLSRDSAFQAFIITDTLAFVSSLLAIFLHFFLVLSPGKKHYFLFRLQCLADWLTVLAMPAMVVAFSTGTYAVLQSSLGFAIATCSLGLMFFPALLTIFNSFLGARPFRSLLSTAPEQGVSTSDGFGQTITVASGEARNQGITDARSVSCYLGRVREGKRNI
ncbi:ankyrin repeat-containing protein ITN1-like [Durio zibethinus]|uniref:Ankyrin repeat-containing protein ITN1-like n=1 Tax=Durio zibethinus TaxID=66656 RepID=A0A6P5X1V1_DURZI|nr:ankyrin repeat-containing protein ITN1-like [Durio zibethinus]